MQEMATEHDRQQCETQQQQTSAIHQLMDETNGKLKQMQDDYDQLLQSTVRSVRVTSEPARLSVCLYVSSSVCSSGCLCLCVFGRPRPLDSFTPLLSSSHF